jgi:hypothetical protein
VIPADSWFKPIVQFAVEGVPWVSNGFVALSSPADAALRSAPEAKALLLEARALAVPAAARSGPVNGWISFGDFFFCGHFIELVESVHPGVTWALAPLEQHPLVAFSEARAVALVMPVRGDPRSEPCPPPKCPVCYGTRGPLCEHCEGSKVVEVTCDHCARRHEHDCGVCKGRGFTSKCPTCDGTGIWTPAPAGRAA